MIDSFDPNTMWLLQLANFISKWDLSIKWNWRKKKSLGVCVCVCGRLGHIASQIESIGLLMMMVLSSSKNMAFNSQQTRENYVVMLECICMWVANKVVNEIPPIFSSLLLLLLFRSYFNIHWNWKTWAQGYLHGIFISRRRFFYVYPSRSSRILFLRSLDSPPLPPLNLFDLSVCFVFCLVPTTCNIVDTGS